MRLFCLLLPALCLAQSPAVGIIEVYGASRVPEAEVRKLLGLKEGNSLPKSRSEAEELLLNTEGVVSAHVQAACCEDGKAILYVGIEERGAPHFDFRDEPQDTEIKLPEAVMLQYRGFLDRARAAAQAGKAGEDLTQGHSLMEDESARTLQVGFVPLVEEHLEILRKVVRGSADPEQRAIAAYLLGYAKNKGAVQDDLQYALRDIDETVRANALRALAAFAVYARTKAGSGLRVSSTWIVEMLNSIVWTDRNTAAVALVTLTDTRDASVLDQIRTRALGSVLEMARWRHLPHALPAFILAGRLAGISETDLQTAWNQEQREPVLKKAATRKRRD